MATVLVVPDLHCPWQHEHALDFLAGLKRAHRPERVVVIGDEADCHRWSSHPQDPELPGPGEELRLTRAALRPFYKLFPQARVCVSNHGIRPFRRAAEAALPGGFLRAWKQVIEAPRGWNWAQRWLLDDTVYVHGDGFSGKNAALTAAERYRKNVVLGHVHSHAGVQYSTSVYSQVWGLQVGCLIDTEAPAFAYGRHLAVRPTLGAGLVVDGVPHFLPMYATSGKRRKQT